jgi:regulator of protease activity HflC (stomatin/prohibitin superfamily)
MQLDNNTIQKWIPLVVILFFITIASRGLFLFILIPVIWVVLRYLKENRLLGSFQESMFQQKSGTNQANNNFNINSMSENIRNAVISGAGKSIKIGLLVVILVIAFLSSITIIGAGETGVVSLFGKVRDQELHSGFHLVNPLARVDKMSIRTEEYTMAKAATEGKKLGDDSITALTREGLTVSMDVTTFYHLDENRASDLYREVGLTYEEKIIRSEIRSAIREMVAQYEAKDIYSEKRSEAAKNILIYLNNKVKDRGIVIEDLLLRDVTLPANISQAIQEKLKAEQESQRYDFVLDKEKKEAERKVIEAQGQRDAQRIIDESLSAKYLDYLYINGLKDRQGTIYVPMNPSTGMPMFKGIE